jgi:hypothetical protein
LGPIFYIIDKANIIADSLKKPVCSAWLVRLWLWLWLCVEAQVEALLVARRSRRPYANVEYTCTPFRALSRSVLVDTEHKWSHGKMELSVNTSMDCLVRARNTRFCHYGSATKASRLMQIRKNDCCLLWKQCETYKHTVLPECRGRFNVKAGGTNSNHSALKQQFPNGLCFVPSETSRDSSVSIATSYWLGDRGVGVQVPVVSRIFSSPRRPDRLWAPPSLLSNGYRG